MSKWINADSLINKFNSHVGFTTYGDVKRAIKLIQDEPSIDIVRCRECKFREANKSIYRGAWYCSNHGDTVSLDDYCSLGERSK